MEILGKEALYFDSKESEKQSMEAQLLAETIERLRTTYWTGKTRSYDWRRGQLLALQRMLDENYADFEAAMRTDLHKSVFESYATEIGFLQREISHALDHLAEWMQPQPAETSWMADMSWSLSFMAGLPKSRRISNIHFRFAMVA